MKSYLRGALVAIALKSFSDYLNKFNQLKVPSGSFGVPRSAMPQVDQQHLQGFLRWLEAQGVKIQRKQVRADDIKLYQNEFNKNKVLSLIKDGPNRKGHPLILSSDLYVLDGSHRAIAGMNSNAYMKMDAIVLDKPAMMALNLMRTFTYARFRNVSGAEV